MFLEIIIMLYLLIDEFSKVIKNKNVIGFHIIDLFIENLKSCSFIKVNDAQFPSLSCFQNIFLHLHNKYVNIR